MSITMRYMPPPNPEETATSLCKCGHLESEHESPFGCLETAECGCTEFVLKAADEPITPILGDEELED